MKNLIKILFTIIQILFCSINIYSQTMGFDNIDGITRCLVTDDCPPNEVTPVGDPYLYEGECSIAINRYLANAIDVGRLHELLSPDNAPDTLDENHLRNEAKYCEMIKMFVDLDITMIQRAYFGGYGAEHKFFDGDYYHSLGKQIVADINYAYDCSGKRRPIIQGMAYEAIDTFNFSSVYARNIPADFIEKYFSYYPEDLEKPEIRNYYCSNPVGDCIPRIDLKFNSNRIIGDTPGAPASIANVEWRMWYLYLAFEQIDMGYKSLHLGIYWQNTMAGNDFERLAKLTDVMRQYAIDNNTFVILSGETGSNTESAKVPNTDRFIFDFDSRAMRPRELTNPSTGGDNDCNDPIAPDIINDFLNSPCSAYDLNAVVDPCTINGYGLTSSGYSAHDPDCFLEQIPYTVHFDGFSIPDNVPVPSPGNSTLTYGFNDHNWFAMLPPDCQAWWYDYFYCNRRNFHNGSGFLVIPGIINSQWNLNNYLDTPWVRPTHNLLFENQTLINSIKTNTLKNKIPEVKITTYLEELKPLTCECNGIRAPFDERFLKSKICYKVDIEEGTKDCSSVYSVHIYGPNGWLPQKLNSTSYQFCPEQIGNYEIGIRQDYKGDSVKYGRTVLNVSKLYDCKLVDGRCGILRDIEKRSTNHETTDYSLMQNSSITFFPNPTTNGINFEISSNNTETITITTINNLGLVAFIKELNLNLGQNSFYLLEFENLTPGVYFTKIITSNGEFISKLIKI